MADNPAIRSPSSYPSGKLRGSCSLWLLRRGWRSGTLPRGSRRCCSARLLRSSYGSLFAVGRTGTQSPSILKTFIRARRGQGCRIAELSLDLPKYNIVPAIEARLGFPLPSQTITVYLLAYSEPHGIRITGLRFLTHLSYPFDIVLHNAIHEAMHPPYDANDSAVRKAVDLLGRDPLVVDKVNHHDASFGYNTASGYIEEDSVQALEQILSEEFGVGRNAQEYWREQDGGMHLLAAAIYVEYKSALSQSRQPYAKWFVHAVESGDLRGDKLQHTVNGFFSASPSP